jgi:HTH-type transcriptional regulator, sugar sensing transcriptional regulator
MRDSREGSALADRLVRLGFSQYEARTYLGLLTHGELTGYALANQTGVPQPKIYETLRRLLDRGAVVRTTARPARYVAVSSDTLLAALEDDFLSRVREVREELSRLPQANTEEPHGFVRRLSGWDNVLPQALAAVEAASTKVYLSGRSPELAALSSLVNEASKRGVTFVIVHFGPLPFSAPRGRTIRHASTEGTLYPSHRAHHLAVVADSQRVVWAFARDGVTWHGIAAEDEVLATGIKGYIRHDLMIQRIYADLPDQLTALYGPGLLELANIATGRAEESATRAV